MIHKIRLATKEYCFIEFDFEGDREDAILEHDRLVRLYRRTQEEFPTDIEGLTDKDFNAVVDKCLKNGNVEMTSEVYELMNRDQVFVVQTLKRAYKRIKAKQ